MKRTSIIWLILVQWSLAYQWLHAGWEKWIHPDFMQGIGGTLSRFAESASVSWYANFLTTVAAPNATLVGNLVRGGEIAVGIALALGGILMLSTRTHRKLINVILLVANSGGLLMNVAFYLAAGALSPSTAGLNVLMGMLHIIFILVALKEHRQFRSNA